MRTEDPGRPVAVVAGVGSHIPSTVVTNADLANRYDTTADWISTRTGIEARRRITPGAATSDLAIAAAKRALASAGSAVAAIDLVILATATPDRPCPATAPIVARELGLTGVPAFDVAAVCSGFLYGLAVADGMISAGTARNVLLIGADTFSTILNPADRTTAAIFGDGAGALVLTRGEAGDAGAVLGFDLGSDGGLADLITVRAGGSRHPDPAGLPEADRYFAMQGQAVYRHAIRRMTGSAREAMTKAGWAARHVDKFVAHQANARILGAVGDELGLTSEQVYANLDVVGNTAGASIPLALADAAEAGELRAGDRVLLAAFGGGATWGAAALTWPDLEAEEVKGVGHQAGARGGRDVRA